MKISERFNLNKTQLELDFVDIDTSIDTPLFLDTAYISSRKDKWSQNAMETIRSFFGHFLALLSEGKNDEAKALFMHLNEPNETCLGVSRKNPQGRGVGAFEASVLFNNFLQSRAATTGIINDLEDCVLFVDNFGADKLSDLITNVIRKCLIDYTQEQCELHGISVQTSVASGTYWDRNDLEWKQTFEHMLVIDEKKILLTPKMSVVFHPTYTPEEFHRKFVLTFLVAENLKRGTRLVKDIKKGNSKVVYKKHIQQNPNHHLNQDGSYNIESSPGKKDDLRDFASLHPFVIKRYKDYIKQVNGVTPHGLRNLDVNQLNVEASDRLLNELIPIQPGRDDANLFHEFCKSFLELALFPNISGLKKEHEINDGRKRIDLIFDNFAEKGFFYELSSLHSIHCPFIYVECKNYGREIGNPEVDQIAMRLSNLRGLVGVIMIRSVEDETLFVKRLKDVYLHDRKIILWLTDDDYRKVLESLKEENYLLNEVLRNKYREIVSS